MKKSRRPRLPTAMAASGGRLGAGLSSLPAISSYSWSRVAASVMDSLARRSRSSNLGVNIYQSKWGQESQSNRMGMEG